MRGIKHAGKLAKGIGCAIPSLGRGREGFGRLLIKRINPSLPLRTFSRTPPVGGNLAATPCFEHSSFETLSVRNLAKRKSGCVIPSLGRGREGFGRPPFKRISPSLPLRTSSRTPSIGGNLAATPCFEHPSFETHCYEKSFCLFFKAMSLVKHLTISCFIALFFFSACSNPKQPPNTAQLKDNVRYTCPMHPQIMEDHPGSCPICGMALVKKSGQASEGAGISLNTVLQPVNSSVISNIDAITPEQKEMPTEISADGYLDFDTRTFNNIASRFSGRIEKLYIKYAFQEIHQGQRIFDIYSPDMVNAQQDLIYLTKNSAQETGLINAARQKLLLLGMTSTQVSEVIKTGKPFYSLPVYSPYEGHVHDMPHSQMTGAADTKAPSEFANNIPLSIKEGMYVEKGQTLFNVVNPHHLWAIIKIAPSEVSALRLNQPVKITMPDVPGKILYGRINFIEPALQNGDKTTSIRVYLDNMDHNLKVNSLVKAVIQTGKINGLWIPRSAMIDLGQKQVVWLKKGSAYHAQQVSSGSINGNEIEITKGLSVTDSLASNAQYLTDSESFIKTQGNE
ncbi:MAG: efflux transporter periplasmic adaptor subunit [Mucilaginibacter sp.]|nr:efflux transporter periplasmic adaptor subunit [Mucilaginibacter sp.]